LDKLFAVGFISLVEEATWLSPIVVVLKKNGKPWICVDFCKLNVTTKKDPYPLPFTKEVLDMVVSHELYSFLDGFSGYHQIMIALEDQYKIAFITDWGAFHLGHHAIQFEECPTHLAKKSKYGLQGILGRFHEVVFR
jgi:hypothetical protein